MQILSIYVNFYIIDENTIQSNLVLRYIDVIPSLFIIFQLEYFIQKYFKTKYAITIIGVICAILFVSMPENILNFVVSIYFLILFGFTLAFFIKLVLISTGRVRFYLIIFACSFYLLMFGNVLVTPNAVETQTLLGYDILFIAFFARIIKIISYIFMFIVLSRLPIFLEVDWKRNMSYFYIIDRNSGISIIDFNLSENRKDDNNNEIDVDLAAGGMIGITTMLKEISGSAEDIKIIDHGDIKIMFEMNEKFIIALQVKMEMRIFRDKLIKILNISSNLFGTILDNWDGNLEYFNPLKELTKKEFE